MLESSPELLPLHAATPIAASAGTTNVIEAIKARRFIRKLMHPMSSKHGHSATNAQALYEDVRSTYPIRHSYVDYDN